VDKTTLVENDIKLGRDIIGLLTAAGIPVVDASWVFQPQAEEWRLVLSSPWIDQKGIHPSYMALSSALHRSPLLQQLPFLRISLLSPNEYSVTADSYKYNGSLHIVRSSGRSGKPLYHVTFAPYKGPGGAVPALELRGDANLSQFLTDQIGIDPEDVRSALRTLQVRGSYSFPEIQLGTKDLRRFGLIPAQVRQM